MTGYGFVKVQRGKRWTATASSVVTFPPGTGGTGVVTYAVICDEEGVVMDGPLGGRMTVWPRARVNQLRSAAAWWADYWNARRPFSV